MRRANDIEIRRKTEDRSRKSEARSPKRGAYVCWISPLGVRGSVGYVKPEERSGQALGFTGEAQITSGMAQFARGAEKIADGRVNLANGSKKMANRTVKTAGGAKNIANGRVQVADWDKYFAGGRVTYAGGPISMRVSENNDLMMTPEMEYGHFSSLLGGVLPIKSGGRWCFNIIYSPPHRCKRGTPLLNKEGKLKLVASSLLSSRRVYEERSVTAESGCDAVHHLTAVNVVSATARFYRVGLGNTGITIPHDSPEISGVRQQKKLEQKTNELAAWDLQLAANLLTIKYNNSPSRRIAGTTKNAHLSMLETMGTGDNKLSPFFLILKHARNCEQFSPLGEMSASWRTEGSGTVANKNKTSAYET